MLQTIRKIGLYVTIIYRGHAETLIEELLHRKYASRLGPHDRDPLAFPVPHHACPYPRIIDRQGIGQKTDVEEQRNGFQAARRKIHKEISPGTGGIPGEMQTNLFSQGFAVKGERSLVKNLKGKLIPSRGLPVLILPEKCQDFRTTPVKPHFRRFNDLPVPELQQIRKLIVSGERLFIIDGVSRHHLRDILPI